MPLSASPDLHGLRVLVVEDMLLVADVIVEDLRDHGCSIVGPAARLDEGVALAVTAQLDGALLDVNLAGERCFPIADELARRHIPYVFLTGYGDAGIPSQYRCVPRLAKPFESAVLIDMVARSFARPLPQSSG